MTIGTGEQVVKLKKGSTSIYIESAKVDETLVNKLSTTERSATETKKDAGYYGGTIVRNRDKIEHVFGVQGFLSAEPSSGNAGSSWSGGTMSTAKDVRDALIKDIIYPSGNIELHYRDYADSDLVTQYGDKNANIASTYMWVHCKKLEFTDAAVRSDKLISGISSTNIGVVWRYSIQLDLVRGILRGST